MNQEVYDKMELYRPYIIGSFTQWKLIKMNKMTDVLLKIDP